MADYSKGWIKLFRCIQDHPLWKRTPYDKARAWVDLILTANHQDNKFMIGNHIAKINSGEMITSQRKLAERWGWSRNTVRTFLLFLKNDGMIELKTTNELSHLTILNYNEIQQKATHELNSKRATSRATPIPPLEHKQECKNEKNERSSIGSPQAHLTDEAFISTLKDNLAYKHIGVESELAKMDAWLLAHRGRKKTRRFVVNWLNKIDKPMDQEPRGRMP